MNENEYATQVVKHLEKVNWGNTGWDLFEDFVDVSVACLEAMPKHLASAARGEGLALDTAETAALWDKCKSKYEGDECMTHMAAAFSVLLQASQDGYHDVIGNAYETMGQANRWKGQYFTPMPLALMMAKITNPMDLVYQRIKEALLHPDNLLGHALLMTSALFIEDNVPELDGEAENFWIERVLPAAAPYYKPVSVMDPCCGSGKMFLAAAAQCPWWAVQSGFITFWGMDIDRTCVKMTKLNFLLYGINGAYLKMYAEMTDREIEALPDLWNEVVRDAQKAHEEGDVEAIEELTKSLRASQMALPGFGE